MNQPTDPRARRRHHFCRWRAAVLAAACWACGTAAPQSPASHPPGPAGAVPAHLPKLQTPAAEQLRLVLPRPLQAATAALGLGRQRLALVLSIGTVGAGPVLASAQRDGLAVAAALRSAGFVVMVRENTTRSELRAVLKEFRARLQPGGVGLLYAAAWGAQVDGRNLLLPREVVVDADATAATVGQRLRSEGVAVQELVDALMDPQADPQAHPQAAPPAGAPAGTTETASKATGSTKRSTRLLVLDAAHQHPALDKLPQRGLQEEPLPPGVMALFAQPLQVAQAAPVVAPLPAPPPSDPQLLAASPFARLLVRAVLTPRLSGAEVLRSTQRALVDSTQGAVRPWLAGDTDADEELAELSLLDALLPRSTEDLAREGVNRTAAHMVRTASAQGAQARAGEQSVGHLLQQAPAPANSPAAGAPATPPPAGGPGATGPDNSRTSVPDVPGSSTALGTAANVLGAAASVAGTVASVAGTAATVAVGVKAAQAVAAATVASTAVSAATSVAGNAVSLASRLVSSGAGEAAARQTATAATAAAANSAAPSAAARPSAGAVATTAGPPVRALAATAGEMAVSEVLRTPSAAGPAPVGQRAPHLQSADAATTSPDGRTTRNPGGGERPLYQPRSNSHGYAEGDTFSYQVSDTWKGEVTGRYTTAIEEVLDNGQMLANGQQVALDAQGRLLSARNADGSLLRFEPQQDLWWAKPSPGQQRDVSFKEILERAEGNGINKRRSETSYSGTSRVGRLQKIDTPAGTFDALPIETSGWYLEVQASGARSSGKFERTVWYSPQLGHPVAIDIKDVDSIGKLLKRERVELTHAQQVRNTP